jgi:cold shock CspA family protein
VPLRAQGVPNNGGPGVFVHFRASTEGGFKVLTEGEQLTFDVEQGRKGPQAVNVVRAERTKAVAPRRVTRRGALPHATATGRRHTRTTRTRRPHLWGSESHRRRSSRVLVLADDSAEDARAQELAQHPSRQYRLGGKVLVLIRIRNGTALPCPDGRSSSGRVHNHNRWTVRDSSVSGRPVVIGLGVRRLSEPGG